MIAIELQKHIVSCRPGALIVICTGFTCLKLRSSREQSIELEVFLRCIGGNPVTKSIKKLVLEVKTNATSLLLSNALSSLIKVKKTSRHDGI